MKCLMTIAVVALAFAAVAQEPACEAKARPRPPRLTMDAAADPVVRAAFSPKAVEKLGLSEEQAAKIKALMADKGEMKALRRKVSDGMERQTELLKAEKIDETAVLAAIDEVFDARKEIAKFQTKRIIAVKSILTPEQIQKAAEMLKAEQKAKKARKGKKAETPQA